MKNAARDVACSLVSLFLVSACSSGTSSGTTSGGTSGGGTGSQIAPTDDCTSKCESKAKSCGAPDAEAKSGCAKLCDGTLTNDQVSCFSNKTCAELNQASSIQALCPATSSSSSSSGSSTGTKKQFGDSCTCAGTSPNSAGFCSGTDKDCDPSLRCLFESGSSGKGVCAAESCCDSTSACDKDKSLLKSCSQGSCKSSSVGYYCQK